MTRELSNAAGRVQQRLYALGIETQVVELPASTRTAREAAEAIGCELGQIAKSLVFRRKDTGEPLLVIASGANRVSEALVEGAAGGAIEKADAAFVRETTGFAIGGVPPLAHAQPIRTLLDEDLFRFSTVWAAAGTPHAVFALAPAQLLRATAGRVMRVAAVS